MTRKHPNPNFEYVLNDEGEEVEILKDGGVATYSMRFKDSASNVTRHSFTDVVDTLRFDDEVRITDAADSPLGLHRPGFRVAAGHTRDTSHYRACDAARESAWIDPNQNSGAGVRPAGPPAVKENLYTGAGAPGQNLGQMREGDLCMVEEPGPNNKTPGRLRRDPDTGTLVCVPDFDQRTDSRTLDQVVQDHQLRMAEEYEAYAKRQGEAYLDGRKRYQQRNERGQETGTIEEEDENDPNKRISDCYQEYNDRVSNMWRQK